MLAVLILDCAGCPHPGLPPPAGGGDAATCNSRTDMWQHLPPPLVGEDRGGGKRAPKHLPPHLWGGPRRGQRAPTGSIFLPHSWGRTEEGESEHKPKTGDNEHLPINLHATRTRASGRRSVSLPLPCPVPTFWWYAYRPLTDNLHPTTDDISIHVGSDTDAPDGYPNQ